MKNLLKKIGILIMVALMSVSLIACSSGSKGSSGGGGGSKSSKSTPEATLEALAKAYEDKDTEKVFELVYDPYFLEYKIEGEGYDDKEEALEYYAERFEDEMEEAEDWCGENLRYSIDVLDKTELDKDEVAAVNRYLYEEYGHIYDEKVMEEICIFEAEMTVEGDEDLEESLSEVVVYKIDGKWYLGLNGIIDIHLVEDALDYYGE